MLIPIGMDRPLVKRPVVNTSIVFLCLVAFLGSSWLQRSDPEAFQGLLRTLALDPEHLRPWNFVTYAFLHADFMHVLGNLLVLWVFGTHVEDRFGHAGYLFFYLAGAAAAGGVHVALEHGPVIGASGGVAGVTCAALVLLPRTHVRCLVFFIVVGVFAVPAWWFILFAIAKDVYLTGAGRSGNIATWAHLGGYAFGGAVAAGALWLRLIEREAYDLLSIIRQAERRRQIRESVVIRDQAERKRNERIVPQETAEFAATRARVVAAITAQDWACADGEYRSLVDRAAGNGRSAAISRRQQLDLANGLFSAGYHGSAATAYESFAAAYPADGESPRARLMLALICARYTREPARAIAAMENLSPKLADPDQLRLLCVLRGELGMPDQPRGSSAAASTPTTA